VDLLPLVLLLFPLAAAEAARVSTDKTMPCKMACLVATAAVLAWVTLVHTTAAYRLVVVTLAETLQPLLREVAVVALVGLVLLEVAVGLAALVLLLRLLEVLLRILLVDHLLRLRPMLP
jgi:hypothetical protein